MIDLISFAASVYSISPALLAAICAVESDMQPGAINHLDGGSASYGLCQLKLKTARHMGGKKIKVSDLLDPDVNALLAARYLKYQMDRYPEDLDCAIAAYNAGTCWKDEKKKIRNYKYVRKVKRKFRLYKASIDYQQESLDRDRDPGDALLPTGPQNDQIPDAVQGSATLADAQGTGATVPGGDQR